MQYWIFYHPGVGGDGFANFLEHAKGMYPTNGKSPQYRLRLNPGTNPSTTTFAPPVLMQDQPWLFKSHKINGFDLNNCKFRLFSPSYVRCVMFSLNTVIAVHPGPYFEDIDKFKYKSFVEKDQINIYLTTKNYDRVSRDYFEKIGVDQNGKPYSEEEKVFFRNIVEQQIKTETSTIGRYQFIIDIDKIWANWDYTRNMLCNRMGLDISEETYREYLKVSKRG
jgi:hypothetical protein